MKHLTVLFLLLIIQYPLFPQLKPEEIHDKISGSVVKITSVNRRGEYQGHGSGVIVDSCGTLWTNFHLFDGSYTFEIENEFRKYEKYKILGCNPEKDVLILKVYGEIDNFITPVETDNLKKGIQVYAYGNPLATVFTFSDGIVSNFWYDIYNNQHLLQFTASISAGSSGGALVDNNGNLIGITSKVYTKDFAQNLNFAVKSDDFLQTRVVDDNDRAAVDQLYNLCLANFYILNYLYADAIELLDEYLESFPGDSYAYFKRGYCYRQKMRYSESINDLNKAIELDDTRSDYYKGRAYSYMLDSNFSESRLDFERSLKLDNNDAFTYSNLAYLEYNFLGNYRSALDYNDISIRYFNDEPTFHLQRGDIYLKMGDTVSALDNYYSALYIDTTYLEAMYSIVDLLMAQREYKEANLIYSQILRNYGNERVDDDIYYKRGITYKNLFQIQKAISDFLEALNNNSYNNESYYTILGYCYLESGEYDLAYSSMKKAVKKNSKSWESCLGLSIAAFYKNERDEAVRNFKKTIKLYPKLKKGMEEFENINRGSLVPFTSNELSIINSLFIEIGEGNSYRYYDNGKANADAPASR